jgi:hypothetical protein
MLDLTHDFFKKLADSPDDSPACREATHEIEQTLTDENQGTTGEESLDPAALCSLRNMFLLLDEWDRTMQKVSDQSQDSSETCAITVDLKSS